MTTRSRVLLAGLLLVLALVCSSFISFISLRGGVIVSPALAAGPTTVSGTISTDTTWTLSSSPYVVNGNVLVSQGAVLTIEPGVRVQLNPGTGLQVSGELVARGTDSSPIFFTSNQASPGPGNWRGISFTDTSVDATYDGSGNYITGSILQYVRIEYGGASSVPAVQLTSASPFIDHAAVTNNACTGVSGDHSSVLVANSTISKNSAQYGVGGIKAYYGSLSIENSVISGCSGQYYGGVSAAYASNVDISNSVISGNTGGATGGIDIQSGGATTIQGNVVTGNSGGYQGGGVAVNAVPVTIAGNSIMDNSSGDRGGGIGFWYASGTISGNVIVGNSAARGGGVFVFGQPTIDHNNINNVHSGTPYDVFVYGGFLTTINAANNWWGTSDEAKIQADIYDRSDDASLGTVNYAPYLLAPPALPGFIFGHVYEADGSTPISGATVQVVNAGTGNPVKSATTPADGSFAVAELPDGSYLINAWAPNHVSKWWQNTLLKNQATPVPITAGSDSPNINFSLEAGGSISGTITSQATGLPLANISLDAGRTDGPGGGGATTDSNGHYTINYLPFGSYKVSAPSAKRYGSGDDSYVSSPCSANPVNIAAGSANATGINIALALGGSISGHVTDELGNPLPNANVWADYWAGGNFGGTQTDAQGNYTIAGMPSGDYRVQAQATGRVRKYYDNHFGYDESNPVHVTAPAATSGVNFSLELGGSISGTITAQATGLPLANVSVDAWLLDQSAGIGTATDANGDYTIAGLPFGQYKVNSPKRWGSGDDSFLSVYYNNKSDWNSADPVTISASSPSATGINFALAQGAFISGTVLDQDTGLPVQDASSGSIDLSVGWHKLVYRQEQMSGSQASRAAFKAPGDTNWRWFSTSELEVRTAPDHAAPSGIDLVTKKNNSATNPTNHMEMVSVVDISSTADAGWYGDSVVNVIDQDQNIHGNSTYYTSHYEAYFYVVTAGTWQFSTDSDDASELVVDNKVVACWYNGHGAAGRWDHKAWVSVLQFGSGAYAAGMVTAADGAYRIGPLPSGSYRVAASAPGYATEYWQESATYAGATAVTVTAPAEAHNINLTLKKSTGSISGTVSYSGAVMGTHSIYILAWAQNSWPYVAAVTSPGGSYTISSVPDDAYFLEAFLDADDNSAISPGDKLGFHAGPAVVSGGGAITGINISIDDVAKGVAVGAVTLQGRTSTGGVTIAIDGQPASTTVFSSGLFLVVGPVGTHSIAVAAPGYLTATKSNVAITDASQGPLNQVALQLSPVTLLAGDADHSGQVDTADLVLIAISFNTSPPANPAADINGDGVVNIFDLVLVGLNFGRNTSPWT